MTKKFSLVILNFVLLCCFSFQVVALEKYDVVNKEDTSFANIRQGKIRLKIPNNYIPNESQLKDIAMDSWEKYGKEWKTGMVFIYVKDMPTTSVAYAAAEFNGSKLEKLSIMTFALDLHEANKNKK